MRPLICAPSWSGNVWLMVLFTSLSYGLWWLHNITLIGASVAGAFTAIVFIRVHAVGSEIRAQYYIHAQQQAAFNHFIQNQALMAPVDKAKVN